MGLLRHAGPIRNRRVLILGAGVLGVTACAMARTMGAEAVLVSDPQPDLRQRASEFGTTQALSAEPGELAAAVADATDGRGADVVIELAGAAATVQSALQLARTGGTVILAGTVAPVGSIALDPEQVVRRMLTIRGVHNYHPHDLESALAFLAEHGREFPFESLVAASYPLEEAESAFEQGHTLPGMRVMIVP
jgi:alcohol dehydrogenase